MNINLVGGLTTVWFETCLKSIVFLVDVEHRTEHFLLSTGDNVTAAKLLCHLSLFFFMFLVGAQGRERGRRFWKDFKDDPEGDGTI